MEIQSDMETKETEKKLKELCELIKKDLYIDLQQKGHYDKGNLLRSIEVNYKKQGNKYTIITSTNKYIIFLDDGMFIDEWLKKIRSEFKKEIGKAFLQDIINTFKQ